MSATNYLLLSALLFTIGAVGVLVRRNAIVVFMCVELMLNAVNLSLVTFARQWGQLDGQVMAFFVMVVAAAEVVVGLAIIVPLSPPRGSAWADDATLIKSRVRGPPAPPPPPPPAAPPAVAPPPGAAGLAWFWGAPPAAGAVVLFLA